MPYTNKSIALFYFTQVGDTEVWRCMCSKSRKRTGSGWSNLVTHVEKNHQNYLTELKEDKENGTWDPHDGHKAGRYNSKHFKIYKWIDYVVDGLRPFSFVEDTKVRRYSSMEGSLLSRSSSTCRKRSRKWRKLLRRCSLTSLASSSMVGVLEGCTMSRCTSFSPTVL
eukprot:253258-Amorphochlora_amoeboformis.AAC.1